MQNAGRLCGGPVLSDMAGDELCSEVCQLLGDNAALGDLLLGLGIPSRSALGQHAMCFDPGLVRRGRAILADGVLARIAAVAGRPVLDEEDLTAGVIFSPKPLRSSSHQIASQPLGEGRASMVRLVSLQLGMMGGLSLATWAANR